MKRLDDSDILFADLDLPLPPKRDWVRFFTSIPETHWHWDSFRETKMLPLMTAGGQESHTAINNQSQGGHAWTSFADFPLRNYFELYIFNWLRPYSRIMVLKTLPGARNREHIDCAPRWIGTKQHKFRIVLSGASDSLYFLTTSGRVHAPQTDRPFIMDGGWPHGMENHSNECKFTICVGSPWCGSDQYPPIRNLLRKSQYSPVLIEPRFFHPKYQGDLRSQNQDAKQVGNDSKVTLHRL